MNTTTLYKTQEGEQMVMRLYDEALHHWAVPYEAQCLPTRHGDTFVIISGDIALPAIILLHGAGGNLTMWAGDVLELNRHYRVYAVDLIGEPGKSAPNRPDWTGSAFTEWLEDVLNALHIQGATFMGISQGGWAALKFAVVMPDRVEKLILIAPGGIVPDRLSFLFRAVVSIMLGKWGIRRMVKALFGEQPVSDDIIEQVVKITVQFKPRMGVLPIFTDEELHQLNMPVILLGGTKDIIRDMDKIATRLREHIPNLAVRLIEGVGHAVVNITDHVRVYLPK